MRIHLASVFVDDQRAALDFYTNVLGFEVHHDIPVGEGAWWLTVTSPDDPQGAQLLLEPVGHPAVGQPAPAYSESWNGSMMTWCAPSPAVVSSASPIARAELP